MKHLLIAAALCAAFPVLAQTNAGSSSGSVASTANTNAPVFNYTSPAASPFTAARVDQDVHSNQAATAATVFVNPPSADTCAKPGTGISAQGVGAGVGLSIGGGESAKCDMRADTINMKVIGVPMEVIKARHCMDAQMAEAYARAGMPCRDMREGVRAQGLLDGEAVPVARRQPAPWQAGG